MSEDRFWAKVDRSGGPDACWPWMATVNQKGYGLFRILGGPDGSRRTTIAANRYALQEHLGIQLDRWTFACHTCDNPPCCNPSHLYAGTPKDNMRDAVARNRRATRDACGNGHPWTEESTLYKRAGDRPVQRYCRTCANANRRQRYQASKA